MTQQVTQPPTATELDGRHDFDFLFGQWRLANRKLEDPLADGPTPWHEFEATLETLPILDGLGNIDLYTAPDFPGRGRYHGFGLRLFDPGARVWRIWWASNPGIGQLDTPVVGRFSDGAGRFECDDTIGGRELRVRYEWSDIEPSSARWEQSFSFDGGVTFESNWVIQLTRTG
jgi:hypothetical protein